LLRDTYGDLPQHAVVSAPWLESDVPYPFANALLQWEYQDATIRLAPYR
jgi:hypothetical protein